MIDVFVRVYPKHPIREALWHACKLRWEAEPDVHLHYITHYTALSSKDFWTGAKQYAEDTALSDIYVCADDDQLIIGRDWVRRGVETFIRHEPEGFGMLSGWSINGEVHDCGGYGDIFEIKSSIGCPYFVRKGTIPKFPEAPGGQQDSYMCNILKEKGLRFGFIRDLRYNHLGCGYSTIAPGHWGV